MRSSQKGSSVFAFCALMMLLGATLVHLQWQFEESSKLKARAESYLCHHSEEALTAHYLKGMYYLNLAILGTRVFDFGTTPLKIISGGAKIGQNLWHLAFIKKTMTNQYCPYHNRALLLSGIPFETRAGLILKRDKITNLPKLKERKWTISVYQLSKAPFFEIQSKLGLGRLANIKKIEKKEDDLGTKMAKLLLKHASGLPFSLSSLDSILQSINNSKIIDNIAFGSLVENGI